VNVAIRTDVSARIGTGHFVRCLSIASALRARGATVAFVSRQLPAYAGDALAEAGCELLPLDGGDDDAAADARATAATLSDRSWDWLIADHYGLDAQWERAVRASSDRLLVIDDLADRPHDCDVLLDQNLYADMSTRYSGKVPPACRLLLGPRYALLRPEFARLRREAVTRGGPVRRLLVFFGGVDSSNATAQAIRALSGRIAAGVTTDVVIGAGHPCRAEIESLCRTTGFNCHVNTRRMAELMLHADLAVGAGGSATWERCCVGLPAVAFAVADNQRRVVADAARAGLMYAPTAAPLSVASIERHVGALIENPALREAISARGRETVDGAGVSRVVSVIDPAQIAMRPATLDDADALFSWRNHESVRLASRQVAPLDRQDHQRWLTGVLASADRHLLIGECAGAPAGVVRFDVAGTTAEVSIYMVPGRAGAGLGPRLLLAAETWLADRRPDVTSIIAEVRGDNERSHRLFASTGYAAPTTTYRKQVTR
jgi:UDP-2,4-diacetamido-2,4,6-trideoxy-beta-L-altropyranose hydrolase